MKSVELRIGNLVGLGNRIAKVIEISQLSCVVVDLEETQDTIEDYERTKPIPLTEEWLLKFGFEKQDFQMSGCHVYKLGSVIIMNSFRADGIDGMGITIEGISPPSWSLADLYFVHQLQNIYFALTELQLILQS